MIHVDELHKIENMHRLLEDIADSFRPLRTLVCEFMTVLFLRHFQIFLYNLRK